MASNMNTRKNVIPQPMRKEMEASQDYNSCALYMQKDHACEGRITREHAIIAKGKKVQELWAIIPLCARGHEVDQFQDGHSMNKEMNEWAALNRATETDILGLFGETFKSRLGKSYTLFTRRDYLNKKYGCYVRHFPLAYNPIPVAAPKPFWYPVPLAQKLTIQKAIEHFKEVEEVHYTPFQMIERMITEFGQKLEQLEEGERL